jgi:DNA polymerase-3 subunit delta
VAAVTVVVGDEELLVDRAVRRVTAGAAGSSELGSGDSPAVSDVAAVELSVDELRELASPSLFAADRVIVVRGLQDAAKDLAAALTALAEQTDDGVTLVGVHNGSTKGKALLDGLTAAGARVVNAPRVRTARDREQFVVDEVAEAGGTLDRAAAADLVAAIGSDLRELAIACEQLVADVGRQVTAEAVATYHRGRVESTGFAVADRAVEGDVAAALETLRWAFSTGLDPVLVSSSLAANLRLIAVVGSAGRGSPDSLAGPLGMPAWKIRRAQTWVRRWRPESLAVAVAAVASADAELKGAGDDAAYAVERAVLAVATAGDPSAGSSIAS